MSPFSRRPQRAFAVATCAVLCPGIASAQSPLDQLESLDERMNAVIIDTLVAQIPDLADVVPSLAWDDEMRTNGACVLDAVEAETGPSGVTQLLVNYGAAVDMASASGADLGGLRLDPPDGMTPTEFQAIYASCGMLEWLSNRLAASGALEVIAGGGQ